MIGKACDAGRSGPGARTIERMLPRHHLLRQVDRLLDLSELRPALAQYYSPRGRPSIDPELLIRELCPNLGDDGLRRAAYRGG